MYKPMATEKVAARGFVLFIKNIKRGGVMRLSGLDPGILLDENESKKEKRKRNLAVILQNFVKKRVIVAYFELRQKNGTWGKVPLEDLLKKLHDEDKLRLLSKKTIEFLFNRCLNSFRRTGHFDFDEEVLWITKEGIEYFNENYLKEKTKDDS
jgi:hypothetical protein